MAQYGLFFGTVNAGQHPTFARFVDFDTQQALTAPSIVEDGNGAYRFSFDWTATTSTAIEYVAACNGVELSDVITSSSPAQSTTPIYPSTPISHFQSAGVLINRALAAMKLQTSSDPFSSSEPNAVQMVALLTEIGRDLAELDFDWAQLHNPYTFTTVQNQTVYPLPADFVHMIDQTGWNRSSRLPLGGPLTPQAWQFLQAQPVGVAFSVLFRVFDQQIWIFPTTPSAGTVVAFEYISSLWVKQLNPTGTPLTNLIGGNADTPTSSSDVVLFSPGLLIKLLKWRWRAENGMDTEDALAQYQMALDAVTSRNVAAPILSLNGPRSLDRFLDYMNLPRTGYGGV